MDALPGFQQIASVPVETIDAYRGRLPDEILSIWETQGYGTAVNGFIKVIDPDQYTQRLEGCLPRPGMIPVLATGMGDIVVWHEESYLGLKFRFGTVQGLGKSFEFLPALLASSRYLRDNLEWEPYPAAVEQHGTLGFDECFGYVPLLALGGPERVENLKKVRIFEHLQIITQLAGSIKY